eukprot:9476816-Pyramimonas_sp.AAC.1
MFPDTPARHMARGAEAAGKGAQGATPSKGPKVDSDGFGSSQFRGVTWQKIGAKNKSDQNFFLNDQNLLSQPRCVYLLAAIPKERPSLSFELDDIGMIHGHCEIDR